MTLREKQLAIGIGSLLGAWALYQGVDKLALGPIRNADTKLAALEMRRDDLRRQRDRLPRLASEWRAAAGRTYSFSDDETQNAFGEELKRLATVHRLQNARFQPRGAAKLPRSDVRTMGFLIVAQGALTDVVGFLHDVYRLPVLTRIRKVRLSPVQPTGGSDELRIDELLVETLVLPQFEAVDAVRVALRDATTLPADPASRPPPLRHALPDDAALALFRSRNVFKAYEPPPSFAVQVVNDDRLAVAVSAVFSWKGERTEQPGQSVAGKSRAELPPGPGDTVELTARYADGKTFGPQNLAYQPGRPAVFMVPTHTPPPPPTHFAYKAHNQDSEPADVVMTIVRKGARKALPTMRIPSGQTVDLPELEADSMMLASTYVDGTAGPSATYEVGQQATGTYTIPARGKKPAAPAPPVAKADPDLQVSALIGYPGSEELIAFNSRTRARQVIPRGAEVDGGMLVGVHPLGAVVRMPGDIYFLYPLGRKFTERVQLAAQSEAEIAPAILDWNRP